MFFLSFNVKNGDLDLRWQLRHKQLKGLEMDHLVFSRRKVLGQMAVSTAGILGLSATNKVFADESGISSFRNNICLFGTQPSGTPAFGQTVLVSGQIFRTDRGPLGGQTVELWFSGRHGIRAGTARVRTDFKGRFNATMTIPRWVNTWVDININCPSINVLKLFHVK